MDSLRPAKVRRQSAAGVPHSNILTGEQPAFLTDWKLIDVSFEDAQERLACNGLVLDEKTIIVASGLDDLAKQLRDAGQEVIETPFDAIYQFAGAFRCRRQPLVWESTL